jgi:hypothetical protein
MSRRSSPPWRMHGCNGTDLLLLYITTQLIKSLCLIYFFYLMFHSKVNHSHLSESCLIASFL